MRTAVVLLPVMTAAFVIGLACGLLLRAPMGQPRSGPFRGVPVIGSATGILPRRPRPAADRPATAAPEVSAADEDWDTYDSGLVGGELP